MTSRAILNGWPLAAGQPSGSVAVPTLTLTGPLTYATNAAAGTLVANIGNVPAGVTPTLTPNDGRLVVAGSAGAWTVVTGLSASTVGTITLAVAAAGANGANAPVTVTAAILPTFKTARDSAVAGTKPMVVNTYGDSTISAVGGGVPPANNSNNGRASSLAHKLASRFSALGLAENGADLFGTSLSYDAASAASGKAFNTSITSSGSWTIYPRPPINSTGGALWSTSSAGDFVWTAEGRAFDTLTVWYPTNSGLGSFSILIDGAVVQAVSQVSPSGAIGKATVTVAAGVHTVALRWVSGLAFFIGMETIDSTNKKSVRVRNLGTGSATSVFLSTDGDESVGFGNLSMMPLLKADLHIIQGGQINDWQNTGTITPANSAANLQTMMTKLTTLGGDVLLLGSTRSSTSIQTAAIQQSYVDAMSAIANGTTRLFYDLKSAMGDYPAANAAGRMWDVYHPNDTGYGVEATGVYNFLAAA